MLEANALGATLREQRLGAMEATALLRLDVAGRGQRRFADNGAWRTLVLGGMQDLVDQSSRIAEGSGVIGTRSVQQESRARLLRRQGQVERVADVGAGRQIHADCRVRHLDDKGTVLQMGQDFAPEKSAERDTFQALKHLLPRIADQCDRLDSLWRGNGPDTGDVGPCNHDQPD